MDKTEPEHKHSYAKDAEKRHPSTNTFKSTIFRFKKMIMAIAAYIYLNSSVEKTKAFYGVKPSILWKAT